MTAEDLDQLWNPTLISSMELPLLTCSETWMCLTTQVAVSLVHGSNFGRMSCLQPPTNHTGISRSWTQARLAGPKSITLTTEQCHSYSLNRKLTKRELMKKHSEATQTLRAGCSKVDPQTNKHINRQGRLRYIVQVSEQCKNENRWVCKIQEMVPSCKAAAAVCPVQEITPLVNSPSTLTWRGSHRFSSVMLCTSVNVT